MKLKLFGDPVNGYGGHGEYVPGQDPELSPCPFCANTDLEASNLESPGWRVYCLKCGATGPEVRLVRKLYMDELQLRTHHENALAEAIAQWNARPAAPPASAAPSPAPTPPAPEPIPFHPGRN